MKNKSLKLFLIISLTILCSLYFYSLPTKAISDNYITHTSEETSKEVEPLPSAYCLRDDYVVFSQNQDKTGFCWNFGTTMAISTAIMKATGEYYDFSELWTGISAYNSTSYRQIGSGGGYSTHFNAAKIDGLMLEVDLPYSNTFIVSNDNARDYYNFFRKNSNLPIVSTIIHDSTTNFSRTDVEEMKEHIYNHGSLSMAFNFKKSFVDENGRLYKFPNEKDTNGCHAISIIGWDDNYEQQIYLDGMDKPVVFKGAWLVLNSYTESQGTDGVIRIFYDDTNILYADGFKYQNDTTKDFYFYDKIETGGNIETHVKGKYYGDYTASNNATKQKNIFYDDVDLNYSYVSSENTIISDIEIYLGNQNVTDQFTINIHNSSKTFSIQKENAQYGQYKVLVNYTNGEKSDSFLNNFFVTYNLVGEEIEFDVEKNSLQFTTGKDLEYYSFANPYKNYIIYTNELNGTISFLQTKQSIYSDRNMSIPEITYNISSDNTYSYIHTVTSTSGYELDYNFNIEYNEDTSLQPVTVFYDLDGGVNHSKNYYKELAGPNTDLTLYAPSRPGYTFAGWYLDYGNNSEKIPEKDGIYSIAWDDIHHMGENPDLSALGYYQTYYKNSNTVFVYARWEEVNYYDIDLTIGGPGTTNIGNITVSEDGFAKYSFKPNSGCCLYEVKINGVKVENNEFENIVKNGITFKNITEDISLEVIFKEGYLLRLSTGENIKSAYVYRTINGTTYKYYDGDLISMNNVPHFSSALTLNLVVELEEAPEGYAFILDNMETYTKVLDNIYRKEMFIRSSSLMKINVGSAKQIKAEPVTVSYNIGDNVLNHYISTDINASSGEQFSGQFQSGQIVYLYIEVPTDTYEYDYEIPDGFEAYKRPYYRKAFVVTPENANLGTISIDYSLKDYIVYWRNWDNSIIYSNYYEVHSIPEFNSNFYPTPTKPDTEQYSYEFIGWDKPIEEVTENVSYTAVFKEVLRKFTVNVSTDQNGITDKTGTTTLEYGSSITINITPKVGFEIDYIKVNNETVENTNTLIFENITNNLDINIGFKSIVEPDNSQQTEPTNTPNNLKLVWIIIGSVVGTAGVGTLTKILIIKFKKKKNNNLN